MIAHGFWADKNRDKNYDFAELIEILNYEISHSKDSKINNSYFRSMYRLFKKCGIWSNNLEDKFGLNDSDIDLYKIKKLLGHFQFIDLYEYICNTLLNSNIPDINELSQDLDQFYGDFKALDNQFS